jgi:hypothetical protein
MINSKDWIFQQYVQELSKKSERSSLNYYMENGRLVMTEQHHINRGSCCGSGCRHCPYSPKHTKGNSQLQDIYLKEKNEI